MKKLYSLMKAIHNKDYSAVKTFKGATHERGRFFNRLPTKHKN